MSRNIRISPASTFRPWTGRMADSWLAGEITFRGPVAFPTEPSVAVLKPSGNSETMKRWSVGAVTCTPQRSKILRISETQILSSNSPLISSRWLEHRLQPSPRGLPSCHLYTLASTARSTSPVSAVSGPGVRPCSSATRTYFRTVFTSSPSRRAISLLARPRSQCCKTSLISRIPISVYRPLILQPDRRDFSRRGSFYT